MSWIFNFLRCILCCDDEESIDPESGLCIVNRNPRNYREVASYDTFDIQRVFHPSTYTSRITPNYSSSTSNFPSPSPSPSPSPTSFPSSHNYDPISSVKTSTTVKSSVPQKPRTFPPPPSPAYVSQSKPSGQGLSRNLSSSLSQPSPSSIKTSPSLSGPPPSSSSSTFRTPPSTPKPPPPSSSGTPSFSSSTSSSSRPPPPSTKPILAPCNPTNNQKKVDYVRVDNGASLIYMIPSDIKALIENDIVPGVLKKPLSPSTYKDYFAALLYAEDYYIEKWDGFEMKNVPLKLHEAKIHRRKGKYKDLNEFDEIDDKIFVEFEIDSICERLEDGSIHEKRPFLLSRDFASVRPSGRKVEPFQGVIYKVMKSTRVLVEFGEDFHCQYFPGCKYDVKFSFNRVCLKRAHQAIAAASDPLFRNFLFPDSMTRNCVTRSQLIGIDPELDREQVSAVHHIITLQGQPPYLVEGPLISNHLSRTGTIIREAAVQIYRNSSSCRILICAPTNRTCDVLMRSLKKDIVESEMFRANAAFRELDGVPFDILPSCRYKGECFTCPPLQELRKFRVVLSTFMSSFRLHSEGIMAGHFSHIFLVDASSITEPETMVALANLANENTTLVVSGAPRNHSGWIHSKLAKQNGLLTSYFERLRESKLYRSLNPRFITQLKEEDDTYSNLSFS